MAWSRGPSHCRARHAWAQSLSSSAWRLGRADLAAIAWHFVGLDNDLTDFPQQELLDVTYAHARRKKFLIPLRRASSPAPAYLRGHRVLLTDRAR
jgi:hypothetical protein